MPEKTLKAPQIIRPSRELTVNKQRARNFLGDLQKLLHIVIKDYVFSNNSTYITATSIHSVSSFPCTLIAL